MKILLINGCWTPNIGNAFVNFGLEGLLGSIFPNAEIVYSANINNRWFFANATADRQYYNNAFDITKHLTGIDLVAWGGMMLTKEFVDVVGDTFHSLSSANKPLVFLGAGGDTYDSEEVSVVVDYLKTLKNVRITTRDSQIYSLYKDTEVAQLFSEAIDCAFFLPEFISPPTMTIESFDIECFDRIPTPVIDHQGKKVIFTHHDHNGVPYEKYVSHPDTLVSELPYDYLTLYSNASAVYSERFHACIAALAYGNSAQLFSKTPRKALFEKVFEQPEMAQELGQHPMALNKSFFNQVKQSVIESTRNIITSMAYKK